MGIFMLMYEVYFVLICFHIIVSKKPNLIRLIFSGILINIICIGSMFIYRPLSGICLHIGVMLYIFFFMKSKLAFILTFLMMVLALIASSVSSYFAQNIISSIWNYDFNHLLDVRSAFILILLMILIYSIGTYLIKSFYMKVSPFIRSSESWISTTISIITNSVFVFTYLIIFYVSGDQGLNVYILIMIGIFLSVGTSVILLYYSSLKRVELQNKENQLSQLNDYINTIERMNTEMRRFKHDYKNVLSAMHGYIEDNDIEGLKKLLYQHILPFEENIDVDMKELNKLVYIKVKELKGLLSLKLSQAIHQGLSIKVTITEDLVGLNMETVDMCRVIGILLDNAIEEAIKTDEKCIHALIENMDECILIHIENSLVDNTMSIHQIFNKGYSTKDGHSGLGLYSVHRILSKYEISLETRIENSRFIQLFGVAN